MNSLYLNPTEKNILHDVMQDKKIDFENIADIEQAETELKNFCMAASDAADDERELLKKITDFLSITE